MTANKRNRFGTVEACVQFDAVCDKLVSNGRERKCMTANAMYCVELVRIKCVPIKVREGQKGRTKNDISLEKCILIYLKGLLNEPK